MLLNDKTKVLDVSGITDTQKNAMLEFFKGAINSHCSKNSDEWFSARTFLGGIQNDWRGNVLQELYNKWKKKPHKEAMKQAGIDAGKLLKKVIAEDTKRKFKSRIANRIKEYKWEK
ncbi:MAG: hypothetical protein LBH25_04405 [Fibromonadaceae bacterium]|jgi:hypothetical protein|nr:hypothetical protein [Fibromonadaceae bacterium]